MLVARVLAGFLLCWLATARLWADPPARQARLQGRLVDAASGQSVAGRLYIRSASGSWHTAEVADPAGKAVPYRKQRSGESIEVHTSLSAHPFTAQLPPGRYTVVAERGKEYLPAARTVELAAATTVRLELPLRRWINMAELGWYSGETHVHRSLDELPTVMLAEDLNVAFPLTWWVTRAGTPPSRGDRNSPPVEPKLITVDPTHVIWPVNTEYEIGRVGQRRHVLGAVFAINHKQVLQLGVPPVAPVAEQVHRQGGLLELDKHNWPWSMMLVPVMHVDLYELTNNHIWRVPFFFRRFGTPPPAYMNVQQDKGGMTERGWINFTLQNYYTLLDCGFRLRPTAGTASGVHPVPLGFGRVYVQLDGPFSYQRWIAGLNDGRSFVTTGPMLVVRADGHWPGHVFSQQDPQHTYRITGWARSPDRLTRIEMVGPAGVLAAIQPENEQLDSGAFQSRIDQTVAISGSSWLAVRCFARTGAGRPRFAHTGPWHIEVPDHPLRPRAEELGFLIKRMEEEIERNTGVLSPEAVAEYRAALESYKAVAGNDR